MVTMVVNLWENSPTQISVLFLMATLKPFVLLMKNLEKIFLIGFIKLLFAVRI